MYVTGVFMCFYSNSYFFRQVLPGRLDWQGNEHPRTYEDVVRLNLISAVKFIVGGCYCLVKERGGGGGDVCVYGLCSFSCWTTAEYP